MEETNCFSRIHSHVIEQLHKCYQELFEHSGHGKMSIEMRFLKRGQKEVLINCGREYRFIVDCCEKCATGISCDKPKKIKSSKAIS